MVANRLRRRFDADEAEIHVVDRDDAHVYQPGLLFVPFGLARPTRSCAPAAGSCAPASTSTRARSIEVDRRGTRFCSPTARFFPTTSLVVASGARLQPEETEGLTGAGWNERVFTFYTPTARSRCVRRWSASTAAGSS